MFTGEYTRWMEFALREAEKALEEGEVPVGAVIVHKNRIIGKGYNRVESLQDPTAHAEILTIGAAANALGTWRLSDTIIFVTLEPCPMCAGAIMNARIPLIVFGSFDEQYGACESRFSICQERVGNHRCKVIGGVGQLESDALLKKFLLTIRSKN